VYIIFYEKKKLIRALVYKLYWFFFNEKKTEIERAKEGIFNYPKKGMMGPKSAIAVLSLTIKCTFTEQTKTMQPYKTLH